MESKYKKELQSIYEMSLSNDIETKDLAINLFWTSEYVKDNKIKPELRLYVPKSIMGNLRLTLGFYIGEDTISRYNNFSCILDDLIHDKAYFIKDELK